MGVAYYVELEDELDDHGIIMDGKMLAKSLDKLDIVARELGVKPLSEFISADPGLVFDDDELEEMDLPEVEFHPAQEGLITAEALLSHASVTDKHVQEDLRNLQKILEHAKAVKVGWHLAIDI